MNKLTAILKNIASMFSLPRIGFLDVVEMLIIAWLIYYIARWIKTTKAWVIVKGIMVILVFWALASILEFDVIIWILTNTIGVGITALIILFQPELRQALKDIGERQFSFMKSFFSDSKKTKEEFSASTVEQLVRASFELGKTKTGALMVIEREVSIKEQINTGIPLDAIVSAALLINVFEKNTPLHDGAAVIRGNRVVAATCYLPPPEDNNRLSKRLGTRHRAAVGISEVSDSFTIVVSEETGKVSIAQNGELTYNVDGDTLRAKLTELIPNDKEAKHVEKQNA